MTRPGLVALTDQTYAQARSTLAVFVADVRQMLARADGDAIQVMAALARDLPPVSATATKAALIVAIVELARRPE